MAGRMLTTIAEIALICLLATLASNVVGLCPPNGPGFIGNCVVECGNDSDCNNTQICCTVDGCNRCVTNCSVVDCPSINCIPPSTPITREGECCPSCVMNYCTSQCSGNDPLSPVAPLIACKNATAVENKITTSGCDLVVECFYPNIIDALQCIASFSMNITSLIINQPTDEVLSVAALANIDLPLLQSLSIINGSLKCIEDGAFNVSSLMSLTDLNLSGNALTELAYADFIGLDNLSNLDLSNNRIQQLDADLRPLFISLQVVNLVGSNFICDCCLEWLVQCNYGMMTLDTEYCNNSQELPRNMSIAELTPEDICPTCRNGKFRYSNSCSRSCISNAGDNFWIGIIIGVVVGMVVTASIGLFLCLCHHFCCRKKRHNVDHEMFKLKEFPSTSDINVGKTLGFKSRLTQKFTRRTTRSDDIEHVHIVGGSKPKHRKKSKKEPVLFHENIYDVDEVDSKFETFYMDEVTLEELLPYTDKLSITWYELGQRLGLDTERLDTIKLAIGTLEGRCQKMLEIWVDGNSPPEHNWDTFLNALKNGQSRSSINHQVADDIYNILSIKTLMGTVCVATQNNEEDTVWESWNFFLSKAERSVSYSKEFLKVKGLDLLLHCAQLFASDWQLKAVFFYILDNIAQSPELLSYLIRSDIMYACKAALNTSNYYPVIGFTAGSVVVRMAIGGDKVWGYLIPNREDMLNSLTRAITKWNIQHKMQDDFARGLQNFDHLIMAATHEDERISYWGIWALANHCITNGSLYCVQLKQSGQLSLIQQLMQNATTGTTKQLCNRVIDSCEEYNTIS